MGRQVWDDHQRQSRPSSPFGITRGVAKMNVRGHDMVVDCDGGGGEDCTTVVGDNDNGENDDGDMEIRPLGRKRGGTRATDKSMEPCAGRKSKQAVDDMSTGDGGSRDFWTVDHMIALVWAKRDQDLHLAGLGHNYGQMKSRTWKWDDVEKRLMKVGVTTRKAEECGKKWENMYQQFKSVRGGKRRNVKQQTFDEIADAMDKHTKLMAMTVDSAIKRECSVLTRQCDILEREVEV
ncbi:hypothetical protein CBR_g37195 [Chara braunii]|uniref:Myb/SANT-like DNA-binding domain-containing protein n=1 Tax=Chara braunii TaxID=69332 RepID=A0A388LMM8_CHABU|nr:hypothetical protein CBR_g37195 [Chara braunii]|eukprot:GBG83483.1 hypothetical protein CBR_g37195 [Chara braunii]